MATAGQRPKPRHLKLLEGTARRLKAEPADLADYRCGVMKPNGTPCRLRAGWGTETVGSGACRHHVGSDRSRVPQPPIALPGAAGQWWDLLAPELVRLGVLKAVFSPALATLCQTTAIAQIAYEKVESDGVIVEGTKGKKKHPALQVFRDMAGQQRLWMAEFGLTPVSFERLGLEQEGAVSDMQKLMDGDV